MPLFDANAALSLEAVAIHQIAARLAECAAFQELADVADASAAAAKIGVCDETEPWDNPDRPVTLEQLWTMGCRADVAPSDDEDLEATVAVGDPEGRCPDEAGAAEIRIIWWPPPTLLGDHGAAEVYLWFLDHVAAIVRQLHHRADEIGQPIINGTIRRQGRPLWNNPGERSAQGRHLWCVLVVPWGSRGGQE